MSKKNQAKKQSTAGASSRSLVQSIGLVVGVNVFAIAVITQIFAVAFMLLSWEFYPLLLVLPAVAIIIGYVFIRWSGVRLSKVGEAVFGIVTSVI